jgi:hypothetical protein
MHRIAAVLLASLGVATVCMAQDVARMEQVVQSYVGNKTFAGSVLVARDAAGNVAEFVMLQGTRQERATRVK